MDVAASRPFPGRRRKIAPFALPEHPGEGASRADARSLRHGEGGEPQPARHRLRRACGEANGRRSGSMRPTWRWRAAIGWKGIRAELRKRDLAGIVVYDPLNVRYATNSTDMQLWVHAQRRALCLRRDRRAGHPLGLSQLRAPLLAPRADRRDPPRHRLALLRGGRASHRAGAALGGGDRRHPERLRRRQPAARGRQDQSGWRRARSPSSASRFTPARR